MSQPSKTSSASKLRTEKRGKKQNREVRMLLMIGIPLIIVGIVLVLLYNRNQSETPVDTAALIRPDSWTQGSADAPVTIVEFLDPECEYCRAAFPFVKQVLQQYEGRVRLVVRYFPLHYNSVLAAISTEAAGAQNKYWEMQEMLFTRQPEWSEQQTPQTQIFINFATELGLNVDQFTNDLQSADFEAKVNRDKADGQALGVRGTPTFFINGRQVEEPSSDAIVKIIEEELAK